MWVTGICLEGNCWGGNVIFKACIVAEHRYMIRGCISFHPSFHNLAILYNEDEWALGRGVECPPLIAVTKDEPTSWKPGGSIEKGLRALPIGTKCEFYHFTGESHGSFTRGDTQNENTRIAIETLLNASIAFIRKCTSEES